MRAAGEGSGWNWLLPGLRSGLASFPEGFAVPWVTSCGKDRYKPLAEKAASQGVSGGVGAMLRVGPPPGHRSANQPLNLTFP